MKKILIFLLFLCFALFAVACTTIDLDLQKTKGDSSFSSILETSDTQLQSNEEELALGSSSVLETKSIEESSEKGVFDDEYWSERR